MIETRPRGDGHRPLRAKEGDMRFVLHYNVHNQGDGSVAVKLHESATEAVRDEEIRATEGEGWGDSSVGTIDLRVKDGRVQYMTLDWVPGVGKYVETWHDAVLVERDS